MLGTLHILSHCQEKSLGRLQINKCSSQNSNHSQICIRQFLEFFTNFIDQLALQSITNMFTSQQKK